MYTAIEDAEYEAWKRWRNDDLKKKVRDFIGGDIPAAIDTSPRAVLARFVATPNFEFQHFAKMTSPLTLSPLAGEFTRDKFCSINPDKRFLGKMSFCSDSSFTEKGKQKVLQYNIVNFSQDDGKRFTDLHTVWTQRFIDFHNQLFTSTMNLPVYDFSDWFQRQGGSPVKFYLPFLALFVCHGILFENYHTEGHEAGFTKEVVMPAIQEIQEHFGVKPLIVPLVPVEKEREPYWGWYPAELESGVRQLIMDCREV